MYKDPCAALIPSTEYEVGPTLRVVLGSPKFPISGKSPWKQIDLGHPMTSNGCFQVPLKGMDLRAFMQVQGTRQRLGWIWTTGSPFMLGIIIRTFRCGGSKVDLGSGWRYRRLNGTGGSDGWRRVEVTDPSVAARSAYIHVSSMEASVQDVMAS